MRTEFNHLHYNKLVSRGSLHTNDDDPTKSQDGQEVQGQNNHARQLPSMPDTNPPFLYAFPLQEPMNASELLSVMDI